MASIWNPGGVFGQTAELPKLGPWDVLAANTISAKELVALSTSPGYVIRNLVATSAGLQCGVALRGGTAGKMISIVTGGWVVVKKGTASLTAGDLVKADPTVSGAVGGVTAGFVISTAANARGLLGTVVADASAAATEVTILFGKF